MIADQGHADVTRVSPNCTELQENLPYSNRAIKPGSPALSNLDRMEFKTISAATDVEECSAPVSYTDVSESPSRCTHAFPKASALNGTNS